MGKGRGPKKCSLSVQHTVMVGLKGINEAFALLRGCDFEGANLPNF